MESHGVEQRIGRIDRFGQKAAQVHIYNLVVKDSIQELIYDRLLERIGIFQGVIGDLEMILEDMTESFHKLENDLYGMALSKYDQEKKILDIEKAIENQKIQLEQVVEGMTNALSNDFYFQNEISKIRNLKLYVTEQELVNYVRMLVAEQLKACVFDKINQNEYVFSIPKSTPKVLTNFLIANQPNGADMDDLFRAYRQNLLYNMQDSNEITLTFDQSFAFENKTADYVNIYNPIILAASNYFKKAILDIGKTFELAYTVPKNLNLEKGTYYLAVYVVSTTREVMGKSVVSDELVPVIYNLANDITIVDEDLNLAVFGDIQENASFLEEKDTASVSEEALHNMESDFTEFISDYIARKINDIKIKDDSLKAIRLRQLEEYYSTRIRKEEENVANEQHYLERICDDKKETVAVKNRLQLANNRLMMLIRAKEASIERLHASLAPTISYSLISLSKVIIK